MHELTFTNFRMGAPWAGRPENFEVGHAGHACGLCMLASAGRPAGYAASAGRIEVNCGQASAGQRSTSAASVAGSIRIAGQAASAACLHRWAGLPDRMTSAASVAASAASVAGMLGRAGMAASAASVGLPAGKQRSGRIGGLQASVAASAACPAMRPALQRCRPLRPL